MIYEQPATLNRYVAERLPVNWSSRWQRIRLSLPILMFITVCMVERLGLIMWQANRFAPAMLLLSLVPSGVLLLIILILTEINLRSRGGERVFSKRPVLGMSLMLAGYLFLIHGFSLLVISLAPHGKSHHSDPDHQWVPRSHDIVVEFLQAHFSTRQELKHFFLVIGTTLTLIGIGLMLAARKVLQQKVEEKSFTKSSAEKIS